MNMLGWHVYFSYGELSYSALCFLSFCINLTDMTLTFMANNHHICGVVLLQCNWPVILQF